MAEPSSKRQKTSGESYIPTGIKSDKEEIEDPCSTKIFRLPNNRTITSNQCVIQLQSKQDYAVSGEGSDDKTKEKFTFHAIFDGHGKDFCIDFIRRQITIEQMGQIMATEDPVETLARIITESKTVPISSTSSGSTMCMVRVYNNRLESFNCGDSQAIIFINGKEEYRTVMHNYTNIEERIRVRGKNYQYVFNRTKKTTVNTPILFEDIKVIEGDGLKAQFINSEGITMIDADNLHGSYSERVLFDKIDNFPHYLSLSPTQALGHNSRTGYSKSKHIINLENTDSFKIVIASDGVWDMRIPNNTDSSMVLFEKTAKDIAEQCKTRWKKKWKMTTLSTDDAPARLLQIETILSSADDISVIVVESNGGISKDIKGDKKKDEDEEGAKEKDGRSAKRRSAKRR